MKKIMVVFIVLLLFIVGCSSEQNLKRMELPEVKPLNNTKVINSTSSINSSNATLLVKNKTQGSSQKKKSNTSFKEYQQTVKPKETVLPEYKLDVPKLTIDCFSSACLDYLAAFAMTGRYYDKSIDLVSSAGYGLTGCSAKIENSSRINDETKESSLVIAPKRLGFDYSIGLLNKGTSSFVKQKELFEKSAKKITYFNNEFDALIYLKKKISSRTPVIVYVDVYQIKKQLSKTSSFWKSYPAKSQGKFMVVTGYTTDKVFLHDANDLNGVNLPVQTKEFLVAWESTKFLGDRKLGPFWMFYLETTNNKKSKGATEVSENKEKCKKAYEEIRDFGIKAIKSGETCQDLTLLAKTRELYSKFLKREENSLASTMYSDSSTLLRYACEDGIYTSLKKASVKEQNVLNIL